MELLKQFADQLQAADIITDLNRNFMSKSFQEVMGKIQVLFERSCEVQNRLQLRAELSPGSDSPVSPVQSPVFIRQHPRVADLHQGSARDNVQAWHPKDSSKQNNK